MCFNIVGRTYNTHLVVHHFGMQVYNNSWFDYFSMDVYNNVKKCFISLAGHVHKHMGPQFSQGKLTKTFILQVFCMFCCCRSFRVYVGICYLYSKEF